MTHFYSKQTLMQFIKPIFNRKLTNNT